MEIRGFELNTLAKVGRQVERLMAVTPGITDIKSSVAAGSPEIRVSFDRARLADMGLDIQSVAQVLREKLQGEIATDLQQGTRRTDIRVQAQAKDRGTLRDIRQLTVASFDGVPVILDAIAEVSLSNAPAEILRTGQGRMVTIAANVVGRDLGSIVTDLEAGLAGLELPQNFTTVIGGQRRDMAASFASMQLAIVLVYLVMAAQFESLLQPLIILFAIPIGLAGVVFALYLTGTTINVVVLIGVVMMAGIVVNNAIVLVCCRLQSAVERGGNCVPRWR